ncbi:MAG: tetratricopeptide repeat protein [Chlorobi bacterium]|nr:tetratricopeptide repeat protein [Chlorobiota bacterium]
MDKALAELQARLETAQRPHEQINLRTQIAQIAKRKSPQQMLEYCEQTRLMARRHSYLRGEADSMLLIAMILARLTRSQEALAAILESQSLYQQIGEMLGQASACQIAGNIYGEMGQYGKAVEMLKKGLGLCDLCPVQTAQVLEERAFITAEVAWVAVMMKEYPQAIDAAEQAMEIYRQLAARSDEHRMMMVIGTAYQEMGRVADAFEYFRRGQAFAERHNDAECVAISLGNMGNLMQLLGNYDEALALLIKAQTILHTIGVVNNEISTLDMIATLYSTMGNHHSALEHYHNALQLSQTAQSRYHQAALLNNIAELQIKLGNHDEATRALQEGLSIAEQEGYGVVLIGLRLTIGMMHKQKGEFSEALRWCSAALQQAEQSHQWKKELDARYAVGTLEIETGMMLQGIATLEQGVQTLQTVGVANNADKAKFYRALSDAYKQCGDAEKALQYYDWYHQAQSTVDAAEHARNRQMLMMQFDLRQARNDAEVYRLRSEQLEQLMQHKSAELSALALSLVQKSELIGAFREQVRQIILADDRSIRQRAAALAEFLDQQQSIGDEWGIFEQQMNVVQRSFLQTLAAQCPRLTPTELRVCFWIKIGLATKEISSLLEVTERDIESHRRNIRRKLLLPAHKSLLEYLSEIGARTVEAALRTDDPAITARLKEHFPKLSVKEVKIALLLRNGYSTKEIAEILSTSERTVENHRYHIRRKLELSAEVNLGTFFAGIEASK